jgi:hypothetical protein
MRVVSTTVGAPFARYAFTLAGSYLHSARFMRSSTERWIASPSAACSPMARTWGPSARYIADMESTSTELKQAR